MKFYVLNLGCKVNRVEADVIACEFLERGAIRSALSEADVVVINTCTVTGEAEKKTRKAVRRVLRENATAAVVVTGCAAAIDAKCFIDMDKRVSVEADKTRVAALALRLLNPVGMADLGAGNGEAPAVESPLQADGRTSASPDLPGSGSGLGQKSATDAHALRFGEGFRTRVCIKMQDGCDNACTYCIVHVARGTSQSRPLEAVCDEVAGYAAQGVREIVLTGINLGSYCDGGRDLTDALETMLSRSEGMRLRLSSIEPMDVTPKLIDLIARSEGRVCRHLHIPLQAGSSKVLSEMARPYDAGQFFRIVEDLRAAIPSISLSSDVIVGFPGETDRDFEETLAAIERCGFSKVHLFPYSMREGTPAALRGDQIEPAVKAARVARAKECAEKTREADWAQRRGTLELVLVEKKGLGMTESYYPVEVPSDARVGDLLETILP